MKINIDFFKVPNYMEHRFIRVLPTKKFTIENVNFNPADGVSTNHIILINDNQLDSVNYLVVYAENPEEDYLSTAWYIVDSHRISGGKYQLELRRDLLREYIGLLNSATLFVRKGYCTENNSAIYNSEGITFNQVKESEELLKDRTKTAWIVGYIPNNLATDALPNPTFNTLPINNISTISSMDALPYASLDKIIYIKNMSGLGVNVRYKNTRQRIQLNGDYALKEFYLGNVANSKAYAGTIKQTTDFIKFSDFMVEDTKSLNDYYASEIYSTFKGTDAHSLQFNDLLNRENGKIYLETNSNKYYRVNIFETSETVYFGGELKNNSLATQVYNYTASKTDYIISEEFDVSKPIGYGAVEILRYRYTLEEVFVSGTFKFDASESKFTDDSVSVKGQPYKAFAFPVGSFRIKKGSSIVENNYDVVQAFLSHWTKDNARIYDLQILPYCPFQTLISNDANGPFVEISSSEHCIELKDNSNDSVVARGLWIKDSSFSFTIDNSHYVSNIKEEIACDMYRICSPHYETQFEFNAGNTRGWNGIKVECTYKPQQPYIHILPNYKIGSLFGFSQFADARGLVSSCSYSLPIVSNAWETYQRTNSTYQLMFDREIDNFEYNRNLTRLKEVLGGTAGVFGGTIAGAKKGPAGAFAGGVTALGGSIATAVINELGKSEELSFKQDQFAYNLRNIQAQPQTLTKVSALDINNRLFPIIEHYTCTEDEKVYFRHFIEYNGYTINQIGNLESYIKPARGEFTFVQCDIIKVNGDWEIGNHEFTELRAEMMNGWFIEGFEGGN